MQPNDQKNNFQISFRVLIEIIIKKIFLNEAKNKRKSFFLLTLGSKSLNTHISLLSETPRLHRNIINGIVYFNSKWKEINGPFPQTG